MVWHCLPQVRIRLAPFRLLRRLVRALGGLVVLEGVRGVDIAERRIEVPLDIFGSAFFMLTRYEEMVITERDTHGRFPARASIAYREGLLERPIVDEYLELLWAAIQYDAGLDY